MTAADGTLDAEAIEEIRARHWGEGDIPEHHPEHPCDACRLLLTKESLEFIRNGLRMLPISEVSNLFSAELRRRQAERPET